MCEAPELAGALADAGLSDGTVTVTLMAGRVADMTGNTNPSQTCTWSLDRRGPVGTLVSPSPVSILGSDPGNIEIQWLDPGLAHTERISAGGVARVGLNVSLAETRPSEICFNAPVGATGAR